MSYVMIHGRRLSGNPGNQRGMRDGLGPHFFRPETGVGTRGGIFRDHQTQLVGGLGATPAVSEADARAQLQSLFISTLVQWNGLLTQAIDGLDFSDSTPKSILRSARTQLANDVKPAGISVINDSSIPLAEVERRVVEFTENYLAILKQRITNAQALAHMNTMAGQLTSLRDAFRVVLRGVVKEVSDTADFAFSGLPPWLLPLIGAVGVVYVVSAFRSAKS